ncbi:MAG: hypothetical protein IIC27_03705, partial [Chloroflexi bacterium]|nr:hypothetical protein [Chloroflexota bacterium]
TRSAFPARLFRLFCAFPNRTSEEDASSVRQLIVADFSAHEIEDLRETHAHRWLGFRSDDVQGWFRAAGLEPGDPAYLEGEPLTVVVWWAFRPIRAR